MFLFYNKSLTLMNLESLNSLILLSFLENGKVDDYLPPDVEI